jgi:hypothetical protein
MSRGREDVKRLEQLAIWHADQAGGARGRLRNARTKHCSEANQRASQFHDDAAGFLSRVALDLRNTVKESA